jgi:hypothetical protein
MKAWPTLLLLLSAMSLPLMAQPGSPKKTKMASVRQARKVKLAAPSVPLPVTPLVALTADELALAERVYAGQLPCELGASVRVEPDVAAPGYFHVQLGKQHFHMAPVATTTGAIRLEDRQAGAVWLQLANKSMLVSDKLGRRLVDACMNPEQIRVAQAMEKNPVPSVLDPVAPPAMLNSAVALQGDDE